MKIFWSWQSDTPGKIGRHFIRDALGAAIEQLKSELDVVEPSERERLHVDQDRQGVPGSPSLATLILEKIDNAMVVIADVTSIGVVTASTTDEEKSLINSNVAIELGYALRALTDKGLLMVLNLHYGALEDLPFDLRHRGGAITFDLSPDADKRAVAQATKDLRGKFVVALRECIAGRLADEADKQRRTTPFPEAPQGRTPAIFFNPSESLASEGDWGDEVLYTFDASRQVYIRFFPKYAVTRVGLAKLAYHFRRHDPCPMSETIGRRAFSNQYGWITIETVGSSATISALTQGFDTGELWGVSGAMFASHNLRVPPGEDREVITIPMIKYEKTCVRVLRNYLLVAKALDLPAPYTVELGAVGLSGVFLGVPDAQSRGVRVGPIMAQAIKQRYDLVEGTEHEARNVLSAYFGEFYDLASVLRSDCITESVRAAHDLAPL